MLDEGDIERRRQLEDAVKRSVLDLLAHEHVGWAGFTLVLNDRLSVMVGEPKLMTDTARFDSMEQYNISARPGFSGRAARWVATFEDGGYTNVFAGATVREAVDLAICDAPKKR